MMSIALFVGLLIVSYLLGSISTARFVAKTVRHLNIYKVGTGRADTENIYCNVSKMLGIFVGLIDFLKVFLYLTFLEYFATYWDVMEMLQGKNFLLPIGFMMVIGHIFPIFHKFKGGRGIFSYIGFMAFFTFYPTVIVLLFVFFTLVFFKQMRFSQYMIVILIPLITFFFPSAKDFIGKLFLSAILMGIFNIISSKQKGEF